MNIAETKMNELLAIATKKGGFENLTKKELAEIGKYTQIVNAYESEHYKAPLALQLITQIWRQGFCQNHQ